jgi:hypothetical protein
MGLALDESQENDQIETINGIQVSIEDRIVAESEKITLDFDGNGLVLVGMDNCC